METPFKIKFSKEVLETSNKTILDKFEESFNNSYCDNIEVFNNNKLVVKNEIIRLKPDFNWNLWTGVGYAEITISDNLENKAKKVDYVIDFTRMSMTSIIFIIFTVFIMIGNWTLDELFDVLKVILFAFIPLLMIPHLILIFRHKSIFYRTLNTPAENIENYNWKEIFEKKTRRELMEITSGKTQLPEEVIELANRELEKRIETQ